MSSAPLSFLLLVVLSILSLRPDFLSRCQPKYPTNISLHSYIPGDLGATYCTGDASTVKEGRRSFPSGHSSTSFFMSSFFVVCLQFAVVLGLLLVCFVTLLSSCIFIISFQPLSILSRSFSIQLSNLVFLWAQATLLQHAILTIDIILRTSSLAPCWGL